LNTIHRSFQADRRTLSIRIRHQSGRRAFQCLLQKRPSTNDDSQIAVSPEHLVCRKGQPWWSLGLGLASGEKKRRETAMPFLQLMIEKDSFG
jgi:hypothetical protein